MSRYYYQDNREGKKYHLVSSSSPQGSSVFTEITEEEFTTLHKERRQIKNAEIEIDYEDLDVLGLTIKTINDNHSYNIQATEYYITSYKEDLELVELGEIAETTITVEQYRELLKLRNQWRSLL